MTAEGEDGKGWDWKTWFGLAITTLWLVGGAYYVTTQVGWKNFWDLLPNEIGDTLAGFAAPLAFMWLVLGYLLQRDELTLQRKEVTRLGDEYGKQRQAIEANELHARRDTFMRVRELAGENLQTAAYRFLWKVYQHWSYSQEWIDDHVADIRHRVSQGENHVVFDEPIIAIHRILREHKVSPPQALLRAAPAAREAALQYVETFEFLLALASEADRTGSGGEASPLGSVMRPMLIQRRSAKLYAAYCILLDRPINKQSGEDWPQAIHDIQA